VFEFVILGGGLAGLTLARELGRRKRPVAVVEANAQVGGLARTVAVGDYRFDIGGHRFHSRWPEVTEWVLDLMGEDLLHVARRSRIRLGGRFVDYPLQFPGSLAAFPLSRSCRILASYLHAVVTRNGQEEISFEGWVQKRFGRSLYEVYFRPYTEKVWGLPCAEISADWASERISAPTLGNFLASSLLPSGRRPRSMVTRFLYPRMGIGMLAERLAESCLASGHASILTGWRAVGLEPPSGSGAWHVHLRNAGGEQTVKARHVVSTIPVDALVNALPPEAGTPAPRLHYRDLICVFFGLDGPPLSADSWTYFPDPGMVVGRTHEPRNWSDRMAPPGRTSLCVELFCTRGDPLWTTDDRALAGRVRHELSVLGSFASRTVLETRVVRETCAYPVYRLGYDGEREGLRRRLSRWPTLHLAGRTGGFEYLNMDAVIRQGMTMAARLAGPS